MDKRKLIGSFALASAIGIGAMFGGGGDEPVMGSYRGGYYGSVGSYAHGSTKVDTVKILSRSDAFPNTAADNGINADGFYDVINSADDGSSVRWGFVDRANPTTIQASTSANADINNRIVPHSTGDNMTWPAAMKFTYLWFSTEGISSTDKIESAHVMINVNVGWTIGGSARIYARVDTISADYSILDGTTSGNYGANNDLPRFDATWRHTVAQDSTRWDPSLEDRDDYHDFGPRSANYMPAKTYAQGEVLRWDVTDALQQVNDNGEIDRGLLVVIYGFGTTTESSRPLLAGNNAAISTRGGNPAMTAVVSSQRGPKPWGGARVPLVLTFDGQYEVQSGYYEAMTAAGLTFDCGTDSIAFESGNRSDFPDTLNALHPTTIEFFNQGAKHWSLGALDEAAIRRELRKDWVPLQFVSAELDTNDLNYWAWGSGGTPVIPSKSLLAAELMVDFGYVASRSGGSGGMLDTGGLGTDIYYSWDGNVHNYAIWGLSADFLFGDEEFPTVSTTHATEAILKDRLEDYIDQYYTTRGRAAIFAFIHNYDVLGSNEFVTAENLTYLATLSDQMNSFKIMTMREVVSKRTLGLPFIAPATAQFNGGWINATAVRDSTMAARQDSVYQAGGHENVLEMWIGPR